MRAIEKYAGVTLMSKTYRLPDRAGKTDTMSANSQPVESLLEPMIAAQFAVFEIMVQSTLAWVNESARALELTQQGSPWANGPTGFTMPGPVWFAMPMVTGIEETLHDEFFEPRPRKIQQRDILVLKEPDPVTKPVKETPKRPATTRLPVAA